MSNVRTTHPAIDAGCTLKQTQAFELIATGQDKFVRREIAESLVTKGLVQRIPQILPGRFPVIINRYDVPVHIHLQWCQWCDENPEEEDDA